MLNVKWPETITNVELYRKTGMKQWSQVIRNGRMRWLGHVITLQDNTPVKIALDYAEEQYERPRGRPISTWLL